jgi:ATP-dependent Lon protease
MVNANKIYDESLINLSNDISDCSSTESDGEFQSNNIKVPKLKLPTRKSAIKTRRSTRIKNKTNKKRKYKDDSDVSDIDLDMCSPPDDSSPKKSDKHKKLVDEIVETMVNDTHDYMRQKKVQLRDKKWKKDLSSREIKKYEKEYVAMRETIAIMPNVQEILKINMPFKAKCDIMEKISILDNMELDTFAHFQLKKTITGEIERYRRYKLVNSMYSKYSYLEKKIDDIDSSDLPLKYKILSSDTSFLNKALIYKKYKHYTDLGEHSSEQPKLLNWINFALGLPTNIKKLQISITDNNAKISKYLYDVLYRLNRDIYGMDKAKEQILCILNNKITNPSNIGSSMALYGPQGVGKTKIIQVLSEAVDIPFDSIALGGASDGSFLKGHDFTYEGSGPGCIVDSITKMKSLSGIIFFDEIDKISKTQRGDEISKTLLEITDFTQNYKFTDKYLGNDIKINLSNMWFIYSLNYMDNIDKTLVDRIPVITVEGYNSKQKKEMAFKHLIPEALKNINIGKNDIVFSDESIEYIIQETNKLYSIETQDKKGNSGVRKLKDIIATVIMKINLLKNTLLKDGSYGIKLSFSVKDFKLPFTVLREHVDVLNVLNKTTSTKPPSGMYV